MLSPGHVAAVRHLLDVAGIAVRWSAQEELRPQRVVRLPAAQPGAVSVVVKVADDETQRRALHNEVAALRLLDRLGTGATPRLLADDPASGVLVMEDLGDGPSLATLLLGDDPVAATEAAYRSAASLGSLHAASIGSSDAFAVLRRRIDDAHDLRHDRLLLRGVPIDEGIDRLPPLLAAHSLPPLPPGARSELDDVVGTLTDPGAFLVLSNGDPCPDNERVVPGGSRFFDFEAAGYRHALVDVAHYRIPFPNCWCWRAVPGDVSHGMETSYRTALAAGCGAALDDAAYEPAMVRTTAAWLIWLLHRRLTAATTDGDARSRQRIVHSLTGIAGDGHADAVMPAFTGWVRATLAALGPAWPETGSPAPTYPAFGGPSFVPED